MKRGFGSPNYPKDKQRAVARAGNAAVRAAGKIHRWRAGEEAQAAGRRGAAVRDANRAARGAAPFADQPPSAARDRALDRWAKSELGVSKT